MITECAILCPVLPKYKNTCILACKSFDDVVKILQKAKLELGDILYAVEFMDELSMHAVLTYEKNTINPFGKLYPNYIILEVASVNESDEQEKRLFKLLESSSDNMIVILFVNLNIKYNRMEWWLKMRVRVKLFGD